MINNFFNKAYVIKRSSLTTDGVGGFTETYVDQATVYGMMSRNRGNERIRAGAKEAIVTHTFYCDYNADVKCNDNITNGGQTWNVIAIYEPGNQDHHIECLCEETLEGR